MDIKSIYKLFLESTGITTDSRKIESGNIFFALKGERFNGNVYAAQVLEQGAAYAILDEASKVVSNKCILVDDVLKTLQNLANHHRKQFDIPVLGITGTNGKTTTKELVNEVLSSTYKVHYTKGNFNNHIGVPLTLLEMSEDTEIAIIEMGANHIGEIDFLCKIAEPNLGLVTNVGRAHLEGFGSFEGVIKTKGEMYDFLAQNKGIAFVNKEENHLMKMASKCSFIIGYQSNNGLGENIAFKGVSPFLKVSLGDDIIETQLIGSYNYGNILTAITIGQFFNVENNEIKKSLENYTPSNNRSQLVKKGGNLIILDAYNANPTSMKAALSNFAQIKAENKIAIIGDMLELGNDSEKEHQNIFAFAQEQSFNQIITIGKEFDNVNSTDTYIKVEELIASWNWADYQNTTFLIKGSRGVKLEKLLSIID